ncbi:MAG: hypothetical protein EAX90_06780 [Candidatus Heimdallarchaeota archaeon]|nr:hypothetical protein [Candidatus Heimdallarchaeota archaeon]
MLIRKQFKSKFLIDIGCFSVFLILIFPIFSYFQIGIISAYTNDTNQSSMIAQNQDEQKSFFTEISTLSESMGNVSVVNSWDENYALPDDIFVVGNRLYYSDYVEGITILDVSDYENPTVLNEFGKDKDILDIYVKEDILFIGKENGFEIVNVSIPTEPETIKDFLIYYVANIEFVENLAYILDFSGNFYIYDMENLSNPTLCDWLRIDVTTYDFDIENDILCIGNFTGGFYLYNHSDPMNLEFISKYNSSANYFHRVISIEDNYIYIQSELGFKIFNITDVENPTFVHEYIYSIGHIDDIEVINNNAFIADSLIGIVVLDLSDKNNPTVVGSYNNGRGTSSYFILEETIFANNHDGFLDILDFSNIANPSLIGQFSLKGRAYDIFVIGEYVYLANGIGGIEIIDFSGETSESIGNFRDKTEFGSIFAYNNYLFTCSYNELKIIDITDINSPTKIGQYSSIVYSRYDEIYVTLGKAYIVSVLEGLDIIDITSLTTPQKLGSYNAAIFAEDVCVYGQYTFIADYVNGLIILDTSSPNQITLVKQISEGISGSCLTIEENYLYLAHPLGFLIFDISDPENPVKLGSSSLVIHISSIAVFHDILYVSTGTSVYAFDCCDKSNPKIVGYVQDNHNIEKIFAVDDYFYTAKGYGGVTAYKLLYTPTSSKGGINFISTSWLLVTSFIGVRYLYIRNKKKNQN